jgi:hypothetical protein
LDNDEEEVEDLYATGKIEDILRATYQRKTTYERKTRSKLVWNPQPHVCIIQLKKKNKLTNK